MGSLETRSYPISSQYRDQLEPVSVIDRRPDEEILDTLSKYVSVTSEKNIWAFWHSGILNMPAWCQRNVIDWVRICGSTWNVRILDNVPSSPNYALKYVSANLLPEAFVKGTMDGPYFGPHSADFLRGACLYEHGGVFMDVGNLLIREMDRVCWNELESPNSPYNIAVPVMYKQTIANHFVAARKGDPFIKRWHDLFIHLWKDHTNHEGIMENPLVAFGADLDFEDSRASDFHWDFCVPPKTVMEYISQVLSWQRLCMLEDAGDGFSCTDYWQQHVFCFDVLQEDWPAEATVGFDGKKLFDLLCLKVDGDEEGKEYKEADRMVWRMLTSACMQKITHAKGLTNTVSLGIQWDAKENENKDRAPGTFAELLRYGTVHFRQTREAIRTMPATKPKKTMKKGVLEP